MSDASGPGYTAKAEYALPLIHPDAIRTREEFHNALHRLFMAAGVSVPKVAEQADLSRTIVENAIIGRYLPPAERLIQILLALGLPPTQIPDWLEALARARTQDQQRPASGTTEAEQAARRDLSEAENELTATDELTLPALWKVTHARLDYYHQIATGQARQSFRNAQIAMGVGFVLLVVFAVLALTAQSTPGAIVTGALGATSAAFAAYIGRTFVRSQETAATHLRSYFDQPLEFSRYLAAERLLNSIERLETDQRATITAEVLRGMLPAQSVNGAEKTTDSS
ncbi:helix-turn-helix transcriptional regulator [Nonomuraea sp. SYSU D8015]|uniref:helix-turn-helix transcriptional regulator n=1 Tax=Nonomuraea sp. SYSU D8015 TaxID=2593644 RepID=UPI0016613EC5|nr:helix-turn-helix transcriptional regulator [Nonomuraea sp. SYSU D8015]